MMRGRAIWVVLLLLAVGLFFPKLAARDLWSSHEARAAMDAESLLRPDSDGVPRLHDGRLEMQKPPLYYWLVAGLGWLRGGVDELAVRLPATLSAVGVVLIVAVGVGVGLQRPTAGLLAALVLATSIHFPWLARIGRIDMPLTLTVSLASICFLVTLLRADSSRGRLWLGYLACAGGVLLKGPIGLALPGAIVASFLTVERRWRDWWLLCPFRGLLLVALLVVPVFVWLDVVSDGQFRREFLWLHNVERGLGGSRLRSHPVWLYLPYLLLYLLPWSVLLVPASLWAARHDRLARAGLAWLLGGVLLLSLARFKRADYLLPVYPGAAILLGCWLEQLLTTAWRRVTLVGIVAVSLVMLLGWSVRLFVLLPAEEPYRDYRLFAARVRQQAGGESIVFFRAEAHALAFRVGQPLEQVVEWPRLRERLHAAVPHWIITPPHTLDEMRQHLDGWTLEEIQRTTDLAGGHHERPLVLLRATPRLPHANATTPGTDHRPTDQRCAAVR